jgi:hypothetical protein
MRMSLNASVRRSSALLLLSLAGCAPGIYPVAGKVVWKDGAAATELVDGHIIFELPEEDLTARGIIQADGTFRMSTNTPSDGAREGEHQVSILELRGPARPGSESPAPGIMDARFSNPATSGLTANVKPGNNQITLTVERAAKK